MGYKQLNLPKSNGELPKGLILISGKNSYGKSTILDGILFAFFGPKIFKGRKAESFITYGIQEKAEIYVYFKLDKRKYYIYRKWGRKGSITTKLFEYNEKKTTYQEVKNFNVEAFFEISSEQAMSTVFVRQGEVEELANKKGADLREMIINLFRLNIIDDSLSFLDFESKGKKQEKEKLEKIRVPIERIQNDITRIDQENTQFEKIIIEKQKTKEACEQKLNVYPSEELIFELEELYNQKKILNGKLLSYQNDFKSKIKKTEFTLNDFDSQEKIDIKLKELKEGRDKFQIDLNELNAKKEATLKGLGKTKGRKEDIRKTIIKMEKSLKFTIQKDGKKFAQCPTCQNELTKEHYDYMIKNFTNDININQRKVEKISQIITKINQDIIPLQKNLNKTNNTISIQQALKIDFINYKKYESQLLKVERDLNDFLILHKSKFHVTSIENMKKLSIEKERLTTELKAMINELEDKNKKILTNKARLIELHKEIQKMKDLRTKIGDLEVDIEHINKAKELVRRFVTEYMVVKRLVKNIALSTNKYIKDFTSGQYSDLFLDLSGSKKTGLSLKIKDNYNQVHESIEALSGGDRTALGIALRLAISELMSTIRPTKESPKRSPKIDFLLLDEPLAALDETRRERILKNLIRSKSFPQIFLITHTNIPQGISTHKIIVEKDISNGMSYAKLEKPSASTKI